MNKPRTGSTSTAAANRDDKRFYIHSRALVKDLFQPNPKIYWVDFTISVIAAYVFSSIFLATPITSPVAWVCGMLGTIFIYRSSMFIHEVVHLPQESMKGFRLYWNIVAGIPMMVPSFTYQSHLHHHNRRHYGMEDDGEYIPFAQGTIWGIVLFMAQVFFQPLLVFGRYFIGTPISFLHPRLRKWFYEHATSLVINFKYQRIVDDDTFKTSNTILEVLCSLRVWAMVLFVAFGVTEFERLPKILMLASCTLTLNHIRTLVAHRYRSDGHSISHLEQFLDSTNITGNWITEILCPCGLRYHALHHLFPKIPYHNLGIAHQRLVNNLPEDSPYHQTVYPNCRSVFKELLDTVRQNGGFPKHGHEH